MSAIKSRCAGDDERKIRGPRIIYSGVYDFDDVEFIGSQGTADKVRLWMRGEKVGLHDPGRCDIYSRLDVRSSVTAVRLCLPRGAIFLIFCADIPSVFALHSFADMPVAVTTRQSREAPNIARRNASKYGQDPRCDKSRPLRVLPSDHDHHLSFIVSYSLYDLLCSVSVENSTFINGCQKRSPIPSSHHKHLTQGLAGLAMNHDPVLAPINEIFKQEPYTTTNKDHMIAMQPDHCTKPNLLWNWELEHEDRKKEAKADASVHGAPPFQVDRKLLKDIVHEKMGTAVARITYLGAGTFSLPPSCYAALTVPFFIIRHLSQGKRCRKFYAVYTFADCCTLYIGLLHHTRRRQRARRSSRPAIHAAPQD